METASKRDIRLAQEEFFGDGPPEDDHMPLVDWMMHDWVPPRLGRTIMQEYLRERGAGLAPRERELVESWSLSFVGLYEVREVKVGSGLEVKDLVTGDVFFVHDVSSRAGFPANAATSSRVRASASRVNNWNHYALGWNRIGPGPACPGPNT